MVEGGASVHLMVEGQGAPLGAGTLRLATAVVTEGKWHWRFAHVASSGGFFCAEDSAGSLLFVGLVSLGSPFRRSFVAYSPSNVLLFCPPEFYLFDIVLYCRCDSCPLLRMKV